MIKHINRNILFIAIPIILVITLLAITLNPFKIDYTLRIRIEKENANILGDYNGEKVEKLQEGDKYFIIIPKVSYFLNKKEEIVNVKLSCTEKQYKMFDTLQEQYYSIYFESTRFDITKGKLKTVYE
jgi:hypothetical protein